METLAWHFLTMRDGKPVMRDGAPLKIGKRYVFNDVPILCTQGYHASIRAIDALSYAPGGFVTLVEIGGSVIHGNDKLVATERRALWGYDATEVLRLFARQCAIDVLSLWAAPDVVREYLETGDEALSSAAYAAAYAAYAAADAANAANAANAAANAAATAAGAAAAYAYAANAAAWAANAAYARSEVVAKQNLLLEAMLMDGRDA